MLKNILLAEFFGEKNYAYEIIEHKQFDPDYLDNRFKELIGEETCCWTVTDCQVELAYEISYTNDGFFWQTFRKLVNGNKYKMLYEDTGECTDLEEAISQAMDSFAILIDTYDEPECELTGESYDDSFT